MAAASSPHHKFWVLPCCPYFLNGDKFYATSLGDKEVSHNLRGTYQRFLSYVNDVCGLKDGAVSLKLLFQESPPRIGKIACTPHVTFPSH
jgi:hypothetical protein